MINDLLDDELNIFFKGIDDQFNGISARFERLSTEFNLSDLERQIIKSCFIQELDGLDFGEDFKATFTGNNITFSNCCEPAYLQNLAAVISPKSHLLRWELIDIDRSEATLFKQSLFINNRIFQYLIDQEQNTIDSQLDGVVSLKNLPSDISLSKSQKNHANNLKELLRSQNTTPAKVIEIFGVDSLTKKILLSSALNNKSSLAILELNADVLPSDISQLTLFKMMWEREAHLLDATLVLNCENISNDDATMRSAKNAVRSILHLFLNDNYSSVKRLPMIILSHDRLNIDASSTLYVNVALPTLSEQKELWKNKLNQLELQKNFIDQLVNYFNFSAHDIQSICNQIPKNEAAVWDACLQHTRPRLSGLTEHIPTKSFDHTQPWGILVLPEEQKRTLESIVQHVKYRTQVYDDWGFSNGTSRGWGITALFTGGSGTGKTLAAESLASHLKLDLYRIDLSTVVSKYIGETEKNLRQIFDAADAGGAILLFDEADAIFGKRSNVKDSHDRYANMEVSYLLQKIESYRGLAILTTNFKDSLDPAFLRRLRFVIQFPFPGELERQKIWHNIFMYRRGNLSSPQQPVDNQLKQLARLDLTGGNIRNIALNAAFIAASNRPEVGNADPDSVSIKMEYLLEAAQAEYLKLERTWTLSEAEMAYWKELEGILIKVPTLPAQSLQEQPRES
ncbi:ATP-binding protein [filamentous cyanobacterium LEGE 11480]|uniref:ATP-binding protein n=1 Tax=Romeriopsis navalis LEGE 11480 TaxID=2777977 RepID=A0A928Z4X6_9CYAN|nr:ATP-binding protein [Romeriopsis navalis]MBE9031472.1 ATP-binding protein [Romeriopsis navalis LEGE 11480]